MKIERTTLWLVLAFLYVRNKRIEYNFHMRLLKKTFSEGWEKAGFSESEAKRWRDKGFDLKRALEWSSFDFAPDEAQKWLDIGISSAEKASLWREYDFTPQEAKKWLEVTDNPVEAYMFATALTPQEAKNLLAELA